MKRIVFSVVSTVLGLVALLSFKSHSPTSETALPAAALPDTSTAAPSATPTTSTAAPEATTAPTTSAAPATTPAATAKTYEGTAEVTRYGTVQVDVTVTGSKITNVSFAQLTSDDGRSAEINSQAGPILLQETLAAQGSNIDTVSGATFTSEGYLQSLQSALDQAGLQ